MNNEGRRAFLEPQWIAANPGARVTPWGTLLRDWHLHQADRLAVERVLACRGRLRSVRLARWARGQMRRQARAGDGGL